MPWLRSAAVTPASSCGASFFSAKWSFGALEGVPARMAVPHMQGAYTDANLGMASHCRITGVPLALMQRPAWMHWQSEGVAPARGALTQQPALTPQHADRPS